ncbi:rod shape-determining protein MreC [Granulicella sp. WH15]|uniref:rod shape-determining protein MreC n=1 Tax=Granulicella sp. WH15 TaxID=2602070 RepID=UPI00136707B0|nr:rod shape-determining protein MreC [Granulicella sp. WH15]QHN04821.1 rod shape-determining protein MreC [Granulicella sp. WH15]
MESFFIRFKNALVLIAILLVQTIALAVQVRRPVDPMRPDASQVRLIRLWTLAVITPFERAATGIGHAVRYGWSDYVNMRKVLREDHELRERLAQFQVQQGAIAEDAIEGQRLKKLLGFQQQYVVKTLPAQVIGTSGTEQSRLLVLDKGEADGLKPDMAVITPDGVVGKIRDVFPHTSQLLLINDQTAGAGVVLESTRVRAVLHGTATGKVVISNLTADERIKPGELVVTSGGDQVFPRGLAVGKIASIEPDRDHQPYTTITLTTAANLFQLDEVLVITGLGSSLPALVQQQLAAEEGMHAADVSAERLPRLHEDQPASAAAPTADGKTPDATAVPAENSKDLVPKPKPVVHPDRYSPGAAPPAAELTPGGSTGMALPEVPVVKAPAVKKQAPHDEDVATPPPAI